MIQGEGWYMIQELLREGLSVSEIARQTGRDRKNLASGGAEDKIRWWSSGRSAGQSFLVADHASPIPAGPRIAGRTAAGGRPFDETGTDLASAAGVVRRSPQRSSWYHLLDSLGQAE